LPPPLAMSVAPPGLRAPADPPALSSASAAIDPAVTDWPTVSIDVPSRTRIPRAVSTVTTNCPFHVTDAAVALYKRAWERGSVSSDDWYGNQQLPD